MPRSKPMKKSERYVKEAAEAVRGSRRVGRMPKDAIRRAIKRHKQMRDKLRSAEGKEKKG